MTTLHENMVRSSWQYTAPHNGNSHESVNNSAFNNSFNDSLNGSFCHHSGTASMFNSPQKASRVVPTRGTKSFTDFDRAPRFELFDSKAEIQYLPDEDDCAARAYADRVSIKEKPRKKDSDSRKSGYDFDALLEKEASSQGGKREMPWVTKW